MYSTVPYDKPLPLLEKPPKKSTPKNPTPKNATPKKPIPKKPASEHIWDVHQA
eukprot:TRINITY_DN13478_c0_g1_i1.p2 TRINITY_DN13478_c0_g1~~TRINITY_DN13478_c0_g1_i1.p2  ORF type:complete len:53 (-),score=5.68 TRINITY_DN13478_c0_g1_i1:96-254(-)